MSVEFHLIRYHIVKIIAISWESQRNPQASIQTPLVATLRACTH